MTEFEQEEEIYATLVEIKREPIELYKILKIENLVSGGGEAKQVIAEGYVSLNGEVETQKRKKVYAGDLIYFNEQYFQIAVQGETADYEFVEQEQPITNNNGKQDKQSELPQAAKKNRKPISF
ncbi:RNA-binding S4 domain-containing protein [Vibrio sp. 2-Bac 85]|uniref:RNA-binding S4 domain-containing protein n=1 Tax=Psychromonas sp. SA13A TaxID=2686346 RepID=UPI00140A213F|nr:RNA-binding S4 domain-containing protein [Psychromonas sp. SA13A]